MAKAQEVASRDWPQQSFPSLVIGADTVVEQDGCILEKPADASDAHNMLSRCALICSGQQGRMRIKLCAALLPEVHAQK